MEESGSVKSLKIVGQPVFNEDKTLLALPNCWHGGCEKTIAIVDLLAFEELEPIKLNREAFLECSWNERKLIVILGKMHPGGVSDKQVYEFQ